MIKETFEREDRYLVLKRRDMAKLDWRLHSQLDDWLIRADLPKRNYVVVESDWPEYETTFADIEARMTGGQTQAQQIDELTAMVAAHRKALEQAMVSLLECTNYSDGIPVYPQDLRNHHAITAIQEQLK